MRFRKLILSILPIFLLSACNLDFGLDFGGEEEEDETTETIGYYFQEIYINLGLNETYQLELYKNNKIVDNKSVSWRSSNSSIARVSNGLVSGVHEGTATIYAYSSGEQLAHVDVNVIDYRPHTYSLSENSLSLAVGDTIYVYLYEDYSIVNRNQVTFVSNNASVASVSSSGLIRAISEGTAIITGYYDGHSASCSVRVTDPSIQHVYTLSDERIGMTLNDHCALNLFEDGIELNPSFVTWTTDDYNIAAVDNGFIYPRSTGMTYVHASFNDQTLTCPVIVFPTDYDDACFIFNSADVVDDDCVYSIQEIDNIKYYLGVYNFLEDTNETLIFIETDVDYQIADVQSGQLIVDISFAPSGQFYNATFNVFYAIPNLGIVLDINFHADTISTDFLNKEIYNSDLSNYSVTHSSPITNDMVTSELIGDCWTQIEGAYYYLATFYHDVLGMELV